jgi:hypothetical protein
MTVDDGGLDFLIGFICFTCNHSKLQPLISLHISLTQSLSDILNLYPSGTGLELPQLRHFTVPTEFKLVTLTDYILQSLCLFFFCRLFTMPYAIS